MLEIIRLESTDSPIFDAICQWNYAWWGAPNNKSLEQVRYCLAHSLEQNRLPQTFVALQDGTPVGMYQLSMSDDLDIRPDIYPWLINVYVPEEFRGRNICRELMNTVKDNALKAGLTELYLYTHHLGLYEKFGWEMVEELPSFKPNSPTQRLYKLPLK